MYSVYHIKRPMYPIYKEYIGITNNIKTRFRQHIYNSTSNTQNTHLAHAMKKYSDIEFTILHSNLTLEQALACEAFYRPTASIGWNIKAGGLNGTIMAEESKKKISEKHKNKIVKESTREKLRQINLGKKQTQETIEKRSKTLSKMFKGKKKTSEAEIRSLVEGRKGSGNPMAKTANIYNFVTNELIAENINISDWCRQNPVYKAKQLQRTANPKENTTNHNGIYAIYITKEQT